jgi:hypothetical protein
VVPHTIYIICFFTFMIHLTESIAYSLRLAGLRTMQIAISMSFVTSTLLISRLSNMFQAPLMGTMVDAAIIQGTPDSLILLETGFRMIIFSAFLGAAMGAFCTPTALQLFPRAINRFLERGSLIYVMASAFKPRNVVRIVGSFRFPRLQSLKTISLKGLPKTFLIMNVMVAAIHCIGVLCALLAGAHLPEIRSTAIQLSGIVNGIATVLFTIFVDPAGARITDQAAHGKRPLNDVKSVVFFMQMGKMLGTLVVAQLLLKPFTLYIMAVTRWLAKVAI